MSVWERGRIEMKLQFSLLILLVLCASVSLGQTVSSQVNGVVVDSNGAAIPIPKEAKAEYAKLK